MNKHIVTTFYQFINLNNLNQIKISLLAFCKSQDLKGTILIAEEGINSTISGTRAAINNLYEYIERELKIKNLAYKESYNSTQPFLKIKVNIKKEIITLGVEKLDVENFCGEYIAPQDWDEFIAQEDVVLIDMRNKYEIFLGSFDHAIDPKIENFRQFPKWAEDHLESLDKDKKIAMFCTGGIRCEKSTSFLKTIGFKNVYHLEGGILKYLEETEAKSWHGSCFVFDDRVALNKQLDASEDFSCSSCFEPLDTLDIRMASSSNNLICNNCKNNNDELK